MRCYVWELGGSELGHGMRDAAPRRAFLVYSLITQDVDRCTSGLGKRGLNVPCLNAGLYDCGQGRLDEFEVEGRQC